MAAPLLEQFRNRHREFHQCRPKRKLYMAKRGQSEFEAIFEPTHVRDPVEPEYKKQHVHMQQTHLCYFSVFSDVCL